MITSAPIGSTVHDKATVTGRLPVALRPARSTFTVYMGNTTCTGRAAAAGTVALARPGLRIRPSTAVVPVGGLSYKAHYNGSTTYNGSDGACEPLTGDEARLVDRDRRAQRRPRR